MFLGIYSMFRGACDNDYAHGTNFDGSGSPEPKCGDLSSDTSLDFG